MLCLGEKQDFSHLCQIDKETDAKILSGNFRVVYTTPEKFFDDRGNPSHPFRDLIMHSQVGLIAVDEVHLIDSWKSFRYIIIYALTVLILPYIFRPVFGHIFEFCQSASCSIMALTATATPAIKQEIIQHLNQPILAVASVNQKNIFYGYVYVCILHAFTFANPLDASIKCEPVATVDGYHNLFSCKNSQYECSI